MHFGDRYADVAPTGVDLFVLFCWVSFSGLVEFLKLNCRVAS